MDSAPALRQNPTDGPWPGGRRRSLLGSHPDRSPRVPAIRSPLPPPGTPIRPGGLCLVYGRCWRDTDCDDPMLGTRSSPKLRCRACHTFPTLHRPPYVSPLSSVLRNPCFLTFLKSLRSISLRLPQRRRVVVLAEGNGGGRGRGDKEQKEQGKKGDTPPPEGNGELRKALTLDFRWGELLNPDPENVVAVALTALLALASAQALWQLFFISIAIILAALKYSFIAALLLFIVITLL